MPINFEYDYELLKIVGVTCTMRKAGAGRVIRLFDISKLVRQTKVKSGAQIHNEREGFTVGTCKPAAKIRQENNENRTFLLSNPSPKDDMTRIDTHNL